MYEGGTCSYFSIIFWLSVCLILIRKLYCTNIWTWIKLFEIWISIARECWVVLPTLVLFATSYLIYQEISRNDAESNPWSGTIFHWSGGEMEISRKYWSENSTRPKILLYAPPLYPIKWDTLGFSPMYVGIFPSVRWDFPLYFGIFPCLCVCVYKWGASVCD